MATDNMLLLISKTHKNFNTLDETIKSQNFNLIKYSPNVSSPEKLYDVINSNRCKNVIVDFQMISETSDKIIESLNYVLDNENTKDTNFCLFYAAIPNEIKEKINASLTKQIHFIWKPREEQKIEQVREFCDYVHDSNNQQNKKPSVKQEVPKQEKNNTPPKVPEKVQEVVQQPNKEIVKQPNKEPEEKATIKIENIKVEKTEKPKQKPKKTSKKTQALKKQEVKKQTNGSSYTTIGVAGTQQRMGTTKVSTQILAYFVAKGKKVAYIQSNKTDYFQALKDYIFALDDDTKEDTRKSITYNNITFYGKYDKNLVESGNYDVVLYDYGVLTKSNIKDYNDKDHIFLVGGVNGTENIKLSEAIQLIDKNINRQPQYIINFAKAKDQKELTSEAYSKYQITFMPYTENDFEIDKKTDENKPNMIDIMDFIFNVRLKSEKEQKK